VIVQTAPAGDAHQRQRLLEFRLADVRAAMPHARRISPKTNAEVEHVIFFRVRGSRQAVYRQRRPLLDIKRVRDQRFVTLAPVWRDVKRRDILTLSNVFKACIRVLA